jgi:hypothetical protein
MPQEPQSEDSKLVPLSQALSRRRLDAGIETTEDKLRTVLRETLAEALDRQSSSMTEDKLRGIFSDVVDKRITRLETSIHRVISQFEAVRSGEAGDAALRVTTDQGAADLALAQIPLPKEEFYPYTATLLADKLGISVHHVTQMIKKFGLRGDQKYHSSFRIGRKSETHKWSEATYQRLKGALASGEYVISNPLSEELS